MSIVVDTNVVVSGLKTLHGPAAAVLARVSARDIVLCYDARILDEYRDVLARAKLAIPSSEARAFLELVARYGLEARNVARVAYELPDPDDQPFLEVAISLSAEAIVTGNLRHFPTSAGVTIVSPRALLEKLGSPPR